MLPCIEDGELGGGETRFKPDPFLFPVLSVVFRIGMLPCIEDRELGGAETRFKPDPFLAPCVVG